MAFGAGGGGKTTNLINIAKFAHVTKSPAKFYIMDSDFAMGRMMTGYPEIPFGVFGDPNFPITPESRLIIYSVFDWKDYERAMADIRTKATAADWVVCDFISKAWIAVQDSYVFEVFNQDIADYFLRARKSLKDNAKSFNPLEGWVDWQVINPMYFKWVNQLLFKGKWHVYCTAMSDNLSSDKKPTEDAQTRSLLLRYGVKPVGQKQLPFQFHTLLLNNHNLQDGYTVTAIKDRERPGIGEARPIKNFTTDYLVNVAGWSLV